MQTYRTEYPDFRIQIGQRVQLYAVSNVAGVLSYKIKPQADQRQAFAGNSAIDRQGAYQVRYYGSAIVTAILPRTGIVIVSTLPAMPTNKPELAELIGVSQ